MMSTALLSLDNVTTYYAQMRILEGISLQVGAGELVELCLLADPKRSHSSLRSSER